MRQSVEYVVSVRAELFVEAVSSLSSKFRVRFDSSHKRDSPFFFNYSVYLIYYSKGKEIELNLTERT